MGIKKSWGLFLPLLVLALNIACSNSAEMKSRQTASVSGGASSIAKTTKTPIISYSPLTGITGSISVAKNTTPGASTTLPMFSWGGRFDAVGFADPSLTIVQNGTVTIDPTTGNLTLIKTAAITRQTIAIRASNGYGIYDALVTLEVYDTPSNVVLTASPADTTTISSSNPIGSCTLTWTATGGGNMTYTVCSGGVCSNTITNPELSTNAVAGCKNLTLPYCSDTSVTGNTSYTVAVKNSVGITSSTVKTCYPILKPSAAPTVSATAGACPNTCTASNYSTTSGCSACTKCNLSWAASAADSRTALWYEVYKSDKSGKSSPYATGASPTYVGNVNSITSLPFIDSNSAYNASTVYYTVVARNVAGASSSSAATEVSCVPNSPTPDLPYTSPPSAVQSDINKCVVTWSPAIYAGAITYTVQLSTDGGTIYTDVASTITNLASTAKSYENSQTNYGTYKYKVKACNANTTPNCVTYPAVSCVPIVKPQFLAPATALTLTSTAGACDQTLCKAYDVLTSVPSCNNCASCQLFWRGIDTTNPQATSTNTSARYVADLLKNGGSLATSTGTTFAINNPSGGAGYWDRIRDSSAAATYEYIASISNQAGSVTSSKVTCTPNYPGISPYLSVPLPITTAIDTTTTPKVSVTPLGRVCKINWDPVLTLGPVTYTVYRSRTPTVPGGGGGATGPATGTVNLGSFTAPVDSGVVCSSTNSNIKSCSDNTVDGGPFYYSVVAQTASDFYVYGNEPSCSPPSDQKGCEALGGVLGKNHPELFEWVPIGSSGYCRMKVCTNVGYNPRTSAVSSCYTLTNIPSYINATKNEADFVCQSLTNAPFNLFRRSQLNVSASLGVNSGLGTAGFTAYNASGPNVPYAPSVISTRSGSTQYHTPASFTGGVAPFAATPQAYLYCNQPDGITYIYNTGLTPPSFYKWESCDHGSGGNQFTPGGAYVNGIVCPNRSNPPIYDTSLPGCTCGSLNFSDCTDTKCIDCTNITGKALSNSDPYPTGVFHTGNPQTYNGAQGAIDTLWCVY